MQSSQKEPTSQPQSQKSRRKSQTPSNPLENTDASQFSKRSLSRSPSSLDSSAPSNKKPRKKPIKVQTKHSMQKSESSKLSESSKVSQTDTSASHIQDKKEENEAQIKEEEKSSPEKVKTKFNENWLDRNHPSFKLYVAKGKNEYHFYCNYCQRDYVCDYMYTGHENTSKHQTAAVAAIEAKTNEKADDGATSLAKKAKQFELSFCGLIATQNFSFASGESILKFMKKHSQSPVIKDCSLTRHSISDMIKNVIQPFCKTEIQKKLKNKFYSLIIDEATDISNKKFLGILV